MISPTTIQELRSFLDARLHGYLQMLQEMVAINSFTANPAGVNALAELTAQQFASLGFQAEFIPSENPRFGNHLVLTRPGSGRRKMGFVSHLDTVFPPQEEIANDFFWREEGERIYGPGTVDIKGGTVLMAMVLEAIREAAPAAFDDVTWVLLLDASEETDGQDFGELCKERLAGEDEALDALVDRERAHVADGLLLSAQADGERRRPYRARHPRAPAEGCRALSVPDTLPGLREHLRRVDDLLTPGPE